MTGSQRLPHPRQNEASSDPVKAGLCQGAGLAIAAGVAHLGIVASSKWLASNSLTVALVGTLSFALTEQAYRELVPTCSSSAEWDILKEAVGLGSALAACLAVYAVMGLLVGQADGFYCKPTVPWRTEIAVFGGFVSGLLLEMTRRRRMEVALGPAVYLALFWIGPFFGFFKAPVFLASGYLAECENRAVDVMIIAAAGMLFATLAGRLLAAWLQKKSV